MPHRKVTSLIGVGVLALAACGDGDDDATESAPTTLSTNDMTTEPVAETPTTTTAETITATDNAPTTTESAPPDVDPSSDPIAAFADALETGDRAGLALLAPGSAAYVYYEAVVLLSETNPGLPPSVNTAGDGTISFFRGGPTLSDFTFDDAGLITDFTRNGTPMSTSVAASGEVFEGVDEGAGIVGTVHSFRYFDGDLQVVVTTVNDSQVEGELYFGGYVSEGGAFVNGFSNPVRPSATSTVINTFRSVPGGGGVLEGAIRADGIDVAEATLDVPPLG
jgi:hypothetical protein